MAFNSRGTLWTSGSGATTPGTTVAQQAQITAFSDTAPLWVMNNNTNNGPTIYPQYLRLMLGGTAPAGTLNLELSVQIDLQGFSKLPTNSNQYTQPAINNGDTRDTSAVSAMVLYQYLAAQAMVTPASSTSVRKVCRARIATGVAVVGDEYVFQFGAADQFQGSARGFTAARATDTARIVTQAPAWSLGPNRWATIHLWWTTSATNLPTWESEWGWYEQQ